MTDRTSAEFCKQVIFDESFHTYTTEQGFLGTKKYGLVVLSEFIIRPNTQQSTFFILHSFPGQLLDIPTQGDFVVDGHPLSVENRYVLDDTASHHSNANAIKTALSVEVFQPPKGVRIDLEPCWDSDPALCQFVFRTGGLSTLEVSIHQLMDLVSKANNIKCCETSHRQCPNPDIILEIMFLEKRKWYYLDNPMTIVNGLSSSNPDDAINSTQQNVLVRVGKDERFLILALALYPQHTHYITNCLGAITMEPALWSPFTSKPTLIVLYDEQHNHFLKQQGDEFAKGDDPLVTAAFLIYQTFCHQTDKSILEPISHLIWNPAEANHPYGREVVSRIRYTMKRYPGPTENLDGETGITEDSILTLLRALDLVSIVDPANRPEQNRIAINTRLDILLWEMQAGIPRRSINEMIEENKYLNWSALHRQGYAVPAVISPEELKPWVNRSRISMDIEYSSDDQAWMG